ncbi:hypothetical protein [Streptosporangium carneum]|uniref:hypothetical protein n=1 Tax=Streptosporangium carneum TaxID=47481 RepID=UPI0022F2A8F4|nr:hypothetical protein [Streptosporangium carneum]
MAEPVKVVTSPGDTDPPQAPSSDASHRSADVGAPAGETGDPADAGDSAEGAGTPAGGSGDPAKGEWFSLGKVLGALFGWAFIAAGLLGIVAAIMGKPTRGPEFDTFMDRYFWWLYLGAPALAAVVTALTWGTSALLRRRRERVERRELVLTQRVRALRSMVRETQEVSHELERYLQERLAFLEELNRRVEEKQGLAAMSPETFTAFERVLDRRFRGQSRSGFVQQVVFLFLAFLLGFVGNWLSAPALDALQHWWTSIFNVNNH